MIIKLKETRTSVHVYVNADQIITIRPQPDSAFTTVAVAWGGHVQELLVVETPSQIRDKIGSSTFPEA